MNDKVFEELSVDELDLLVKTMATLTDDLQKLTELLEKAALESEDSKMVQAAQIVADTITKIRAELRAGHRDTGHNHVPR